VQSKLNFGSYKASQLQVGPFKSGVMDIGARYIDLLLSSKTAGSDDQHRKAGEMHPLTRYK